MASSKSVLPPRLKDWVPGLPQIGVFVRTLDGGVIEWISNRATQKQQDAILELIKSKPHPDDYKGPALWVDKRGRVEVRCLLGHWTASEDPERKEIASKTLARICAGSLILDLRSVGNLDEWGETQIRNTVATHQNRISLVIQGDLPSVAGLQVPIFNDVNSALDSFI